MALSIKDEATDRVVRRYAALRQTSYTHAIKLAVTEALEREGGSVDEDLKRQGDDFVTFVRDLQRRVAMAPTLDHRTPDEIIGYDEDGLPA